MSDALHGPAPADPWAHLRRYTPARIGLGRSGRGLLTRDLLALGLAHASARDAVHVPLDLGGLDAALRAAGHVPLYVDSAAVDRPTYLARPDLGRRLAERSVHALRASAPGPTDVAVVVADGLSAVAVQRHAVPLLASLAVVAPTRWSRLPIVVACQARVALGDEVGEHLSAKLVVVLIGERPGLSCADSLGIYLTHAPRTGRTDGERNCISNLRPGGMSYDEAAHRLDWLAREALRRGLTGVQLTDESAPLLPGSSAAAGAESPDRGRQMPDVV